MSNRLFQNVIYQMRDALGRIAGVIDEDTTVIACTELKSIGRSGDFFNIEIGETRGIFVRDGYTYKPFGPHMRPEYAVFVEGIDETAAKFASILAVSLLSIKQYHDEKYDRNSFIKNVILDNVLPGDIGLKSRELHFSTDVYRAALLINIVSQNDAPPFDVIQNLFPDKNRDFLINITESDIVLVKEVKPETDVKELERIARTISDTLAGEFFTHVNIGIGTPVIGVRELSKSFREAKISLEVGKVFDNDKSIISYENLGIARLIYHIPATLCNTFLHEIFKKGSIDSLDHETLFTIQRFFENNLNVSETAKKIFVHRNTLVYRLDKVKKLTGLDLREFEHAIMFKIALMVKKYLSANLVKY